MTEEKFMKGLYDEANEELKEVYNDQKEVRDDILKEIALIMLTYNVLDGLMNISKSNKDKSYKGLSSIIFNGHKSIGKNQINTIGNILSSTVNKTFNHYSYNSNLKDVKGIIDSNFKGKHFSERVWNNEQETAKKLHKQVNDFLNGKVNVNKIKKEIELTYNNGAYNTKRLVETEVSRCSSAAFDRFCVETDVKKVRYNATLCNTCDKCMAYHNRVFDFKDKIEIPRHPRCHCFYDIEDDEAKKAKLEKDINNTGLQMNLQLFGIDEKKELQKLIDAGVINEGEYLKCYDYFNKRFKKGIDTPIGSVYNKRDRFVHIARRHKNMISKEQIDNIIYSLENPDKIYKSVDKFGIQAKGYVKKINNNELLTIVRGGIITSYYPDKNYINNKIKKGEFKLIWERK